MALPMFEQTMGKLYLKQIPMLNHKFTMANYFINLIWPSIRQQILSYESFGGLFLFWRHSESILFIVSIFIFFVLCFLRFYGNATLKYCFEFFYIKKIFFSLYITCSSKKKKKFNFDKSKSLLINSIPIVLLVINHIEILLLNNHFFNKRNIVKNFDITS